MAMKFIVFEMPGGDAPVLFPTGFQHAWVAGQLAPLKPVSAGFAEIRDGRAHCFGTSQGLRIPARPGIDSDLVNRLLKGPA